MAKNKLLIILLVGFLVLILYFLYSSKVSSGELPLKISCQDNCIINGMFEEDTPDSIPMGWRELIEGEFRVKEINGNKVVGIGLGGAMNSIVAEQIITDTFKIAQFKDKRLKFDLKHMGGETTVCTTELCLVDNNGVSCGFADSVGNSCRGFPIVKDIESNITFLKITAKAVGAQQGYFDYVDDLNLNIIEKINNESTIGNITKQIKSFDRATYEGNCRDVDSQIDNNFSTGIWAPDYNPGCTIYEDFLINEINILNITSDISINLGSSSFTYCFDYNSGSWLQIGFRGGGIISNSCFGDVVKIKITLPGGACYGGSSFDRCPAYTEGRLVIFSK